jgi:esterase/lipase
MTDYATRIFSNEKPPITIAESITSSTSSFLFIAAGNVADEIEFNSFYNELTEPKSTLYIVDNCGHTEGIDCEREIYSSQILRFFEENLRK